MVDLEPLADKDDVDELVFILSLHADYTGSTVAQKIIEAGRDMLRDQFIKVMPVDYKRALAEQSADSDQ
jgi:glutamate synthase domain-containing protein 3